MINHNPPTNYTLFMAYKTQERKEFLAQCYKRGLTKVKALSLWIKQENLAKPHDHQ